MTEDDDVILLGFMVALKRYHDAVEANLQSLAQDAADMRDCQTQPSTEHSIDTLIYAANMAGQVCSLKVQHCCHCQCRHHLHTHHHHYCCCRRHHHHSRPQQCHHHIKKLDTICSGGQHTPLQSLPMHEAPLHCISASRTAGTLKNVFH